MSGHTDVSVVRNSKKKKDVQAFPCACEKVQSFKESVTDLVWEVVNSAKLEEKTLITSHLKIPDMLDSDSISCPLSVSRYDLGLNFLY